MATTIFHENTALVHAAGHMGSIIQSMEGITRNIDRLHDKNLSAWEGKAADQGARNVQTLRRKMEAYLLDAQQTKTALDQAVQAYERTEKTQVDNVSKLNTKDIF